VIVSANKKHKPSEDSMGDALFLFRNVNEERPSDNG